MTSQFRPGDRVRCIDASLSSNRLTCGSVYEVVEMSDKHHVVLVAVTGGWETDRFEKIDAPVPVTSAPDAAAELEKIERMLEGVKFADAVTTLDKIRDIVAYHIHICAVQHIERLEAIK